MLIWYKMMHKLSYEHDIGHSRSKIRALHPKNSLTIRKNYLEPNYANLVIKDKDDSNCKITSDEFKIESPAVTPQKNVVLTNVSYQWLSLLVSMAVEISSL